MQVDPKSENSALSVRLEIVTMLYKHLPIAIIANVVNTIAIALLFYDTREKGMLVIWLALNAFGIVIRYLLYTLFQRFNERRQDIRWDLLFDGAISLGGVAFGSAPFFLLQSSDIPHTVILTFFIGGMTAGAAGTYAIRSRVVFLYSLTMLIPILYYIFSRIENPIYFFLATGTLLFFCLILLISLQIKQSILRGIKLRFENDDLIRFLSKSKERSEQLNWELSNQIKEKENTERNLAEEKQKFQNYVEIAGTAFLILNERLMVTLINKKGAEIFGHPPDQIENNFHFPDLIPENEREEIRRKLKGLLENTEETLYAFENTINDASGMEKTVRWHVTTLSDSSRTELELLLSGLDISETKRQKEQIQHSEKRFRDMFAKNTAPMMLLDPEMETIVEVNDAASRLYGYSTEEMTNMAILKTYAIGDLEHIRARKGTSFVSHHTMADLSKRFVEIHITPIVFQNRTFIASIIHDITHRIHLEEQSKLASKVYANANEGIIITDQNARILSINRAFTRITGYEETEITGRTPSILKSGLHDREFYLNMWEQIRNFGSWEGEIWNKNKSGQLYPELLSISAITDQKGEIKNYVGIITDISKMKESEERLRQLAHYDPLTKLPNRNLMNIHLKHAIEHSKRTNKLIGVFFLDLDRFKLINDTLGHDTGDSLLVSVARRLLESVRKSDTVVRLGGDEFVIILEEIQNINNLTHVSQSVMNAFTEPFNLNGRQIFITPSIGISIYPYDGDDIMTLLKNADTAMYEAKKAGKNNFKFFTTEMNQQVSTMLELEISLRRALTMNEFIIHYQPQIDLQTEKIIGFEALIRWQHPELGLLSPYRFIPLAKESGLILQISEYIVDLSCQKLRELKLAGFDDIAISINITAEHLKSKGFITIIENAIEMTGIDPRNLLIEITEDAMVENFNQAAYIMETLQIKGVRFCIDDFGTGYSSMNYLKRLPINKLKIDQTFIFSIPGNYDDTAIVKAIIALARALNITVIAEGIETIEQKEFLKQNGCDEGQGFYYSHPVPGDQCIEILQKGIALKQG